MGSQCKVSLNLDINKYMPYDEYKEKFWGNLCKIEIKCAEKIGECKHNLGDTFIYENPYSRPENVCFSLLHVLDLFTWRVTLGFPSWNAEDPSVYVIHCPDRTGTVWEMRRIEDK